MELEDVAILIEEAKCLACLMPGELDYIEAYLLAEWAAQ